MVTETEIPLGPRNAHLGRIRHEIKSFGVWRNAVVRHDRQGDQSGNRPQRKLARFHERFRASRQRRRLCVWVRLGRARSDRDFFGRVLTLGPNSVNDPNPFWYTPSGGPGATGNKICDANIYQEKTDTFAGQQVIFTGTVLANTLANGYTSMAFIKDFAPDYSSSRTASVPLTPGVFSVSLATGPQPGRHVQFGFETIGPDVWITDRAPIGTVKVTTGPGDFNQNGVVDAGDIAAMATALTDEPTFAAGHGLTTAQLALIGDLDGDSKFTNADLPVLLTQLSVGGGSLASVPEPASLILLALGGIGLATLKQRPLCAPVS